MDFEAKLENFYCNLELIEADARFDVRQKIFRSITDANTRERCLSDAGVKLRRDSLKD